MSVNYPSETPIPSPPPLSRAERGDDWCKCGLVHLRGIP